MDPVYCLNLTGIYNETLVSETDDNDALNFTCGIRVGNTFAIPVFNQMGSNGSVSSPPCYCNCNSNGGPGVDWTSYCNVFDFLVSLIMFNTDDEYYNLRSMLHVQSRNLNNGIGRNAYNASYASATLNYDGYNKLLLNPEWRKDAFEFCNVPELDISCSILTFNLYDDFSTTVSQFSYQLNNGSCRDSISLSETGWNNLLAAPPTQLTQAYYKCTETPSSALFNAVGIASGNVSTVIPIVVIFLLPVMYLFLQAIGQVPPKVEYTKEELQDSLEALALQLLRMRDGKTRGLKLHGQIAKLTYELVEAAKIEGGYPDSDDSADEDDNDDEELLQRHSAYGTITKINKNTAILMNNNTIIDTNENGLELRTTNIRKTTTINNNDNNKLERASNLPQKLNITRMYTQGGKKHRGAVFTKHIELANQLDERKDGISLYNDSTSKGWNNFFNTNNINNKNILRQSTASNITNDTELGNPMHDNRISRISSSSRSSRISRSSAYRGPHRIKRQIDSDDEYEEERYSTRKSVLKRKKERKEKNKQKLPGINKNDFEEESKFANVLLLNDGTPGYIAFNPIPLDNFGFIAIERLGAICHELRRLLGECIMFERSSNDLDTESSSIRLARDSPTYVDAANMSHNLSKIDLAALLKKYNTEKKIYIEIHTLLCMHASIALNIPVVEVNDGYGNLVAYQLGQRIFTANDMRKLCGDDSSYRDSIVL